MWQNIKSNPVLWVVIGILVIAFGLTTYFLIDANYGLRRDNRALKRENKDLELFNEVLIEKNDSIIKVIENRNEIISQSTVVYDSLLSVLDNLNNQRIVTVYENYSNVTRLDLNGQIEFLSKFISTSDSIRN